MVEPPESPAFGKEAAEILEVPGPLCEEVPSGHGPHCSAPGSAAPPGLGTATESRGPCGPELLFMLPYSAACDGQSDPRPSVYSSANGPLVPPVAQASLNDTQP